MINISNLSKSYRKNCLFRDLNVDFAENKKIMIVGENGSGKSVLLKLLVGYSLPDSGEISVDGIKIGKDRDFMPEVGTFINAPEFIPYLSGKDNLKILQKMLHRCSDQELDEYINLFKLADIINNKYKTYSLGTKQKLRIIQALMDKPKYLIFDEPFEALDKESKDIFIEILEKFIKVEGHTLIFTSHMSEMLDFADIIYRVENYNLKKVK